MNKRPYHNAYQIHRVNMEPSHFKDTACYAFYQTVSLANYMMHSRVEGMCDLIGAIT
jgi:hypothetical protein